MADPCQAELEAVVDADVAFVIAQVNKLVADVNLYVCRQNNPPAPPPGPEATIREADLDTMQQRVIKSVTKLMCDRCETVSTLLKRKPSPMLLAMCRQEHRHLRDLFHGLTQLGTGPS